MRYSRPLLICFAGLALLISPTCATPKPHAALIAEGGNPQFPQPNWNLKYSSGPLGLKKDQWLKAAFVSGPAPSQANPWLTIPVGDLRKVYFQPKAERDSDKMEHMSRSGCSYAQNLMPKSNLARPPETFMAWVIAPNTLRRAAEHLNERYPVRFVWNDNGTEKELAFSVRSCEYESFLANLRWVVGQRWKDIEHEFPK